MLKRTLTAIALIAATSLAAAARALDCFVASLLAMTAGRCASALITIQLSNSRASEQQTRVIASVHSHGCCSPIYSEHGHRFPFDDRCRCGCGRHRLDDAPAEL